MNVETTYLANYANCKRNMSVLRCKRQAIYVVTHRISENKNPQPFGSPESFKFRNRSGRSDLKQPDRFSLQLRKDGAERCVNAKVEIPKSEINKRRLKRPNPRLQPAALGPRLSSFSRTGAAFIDRQPRRVPCFQPLLCLAWVCHCFLF